MTARRSSVYFIEAANGMMKIGVSETPVRRAKNLLGSSPVKVRLVAAVEGSFPEERAFHARFEHLRSHGEWLFFVGELADFVATIRGAGVPRILDWDEIGWRTDPEHLKRGRERHRQIITANWANPEWRKRHNKPPMKMQVAQMIGAAE